MRLFPGTSNNLIDFGLVPTGTVTFPPSGPMAGPQGATTLTNKPAGPPGKNFTRQHKKKFIEGIYQEGLLAKNALKGMTELERAEFDLASAEEAHASAYDQRDTESILRDAQQRVDWLRAEKAKKEAMDAARAHWRQLVDKATKRH